MVSLVRSGQLPLWNQYLFCGWPLFAALQAGFLYPLSLIYYVLPFDLAFNYYTIVHYILGAVFMYWLARYFRLERVPAVMSGLVFAFSGYLLSMANMNTTLTSVIWLPLILLTYEKLLAGFSWRGWLFLSLLLAVQFLAGEPTVLFISAIFLFFYGLVLPGPGKRLRAVISLAGASVLAGGLSAVQLLPFLELLANSVRFSRTSFDFVSGYSFPPRELLCLVLPFFFGELVRTGTYTKALLGDQQQIWLLSPYIGVLPFLLAGLTWTKRDKRTLLIWAAVILSLFLAFGRFAPVYKAFYLFLPGVSLIRYPVKFIFLAVFSLALLSGQGLQLFLDMSGQGKNKLKVPAMVLSGLFAGTALVCLAASRNLAGIYRYVHSFYPAGLSAYHQGLLWKILTADLAFLWQLAVVLGIVLVLVWLALNDRLRPAFLAGLIVVIVALDLAAANIGLNPPADRRVFGRSTPNIDLLSADRGLWRYYAVPPQGKEAAVVFQDFDQNLLQLKDNLSPNMLLPYRLACFAGRASIEPGGFAGPAAGELPDEQLDLANVKYIFTFKEIRHPAYKVLRVKPFASMKGYLYQNLKVQPRAYFIDGPESSGQSRGLMSRESVKIVDYQANKVVLRTSTVRPRHLLLSDTYYPGWKAYVDGEKTIIIRAGERFRAVKVPAGEHQIVFKYQPLSFRLGALISLLCVAGAGVVFVRNRS